ncbi:hypothetical protein GCM10028803_54500 [Larkinella knui]|uniref:Tubulin/FtsZ GTPase domain-containing protein n=1 Tax=Larkinella knui TaxID=2025310 RepID=A0A3P1CGF5_9BACT|nr:hypothetical protein [Larkinella knui]RRB12347.1 hypothetical protein EHT87_19295 [Larkinella knui]
MDTLFTGIGIGPLGVNVLEHLYNRGMHDLTAIACLTDSDQLRASFLPNKVVLTGDESGSSLTDALQPMIGSSELVFIVADLNEPNTSRAVLQTAGLVHSLNRLSVAIIPLSIDFPEADSTPLDELDHLCDGLIAFAPSDSGDDLQFHQMTKAIEGLADLCRHNLGMVDFEDIRYVMRGMGRGAVVDEKATGENRCEAVLEKAFRQLEACAFDVTRIDRVLMQLSYSPHSPLLMREQRTLTQGLLDHIGSDPRLFKVAYLSDSKLDDQIRLTVLLWAPMNDSGPTVQ